MLHAPAAKAMKPYKLALIFTGHMIDLPDRELPRFPPAMERLATTAIRQRIAYAKRAAHGSVVGIASGARGGDILFLEACRKAGLDIRIVLPFPPEKFLETSVRGVAGADWERRFTDLWRTLSPSQREALRVPKGTNPYDFCNRRMLSLAAQLAGRLRLIALWDGKDKEPKPGGTASFVELARRSGGRFVHIDTETLLRRMSASRSSSGARPEA